eukprot:TRINITY_DN10059_c0_g2_i1.p1 TRINITY_DN10059_c0_g2~~TRINITY_DN10059_c0_g2_i1.p1  ORF type:complete len:137 (-),score=25.51 TRINITY_DN10059_c0_g2_i1:271-681(-)
MGEKMQEKQEDVHGDVHVLEIDNHDREVELEVEEYKASTSFDQWEIQSVDANHTTTTKPGLATVYDRDQCSNNDEQGLSKAFRITVILASVLLMLGVILVIAVFLPRDSKHDHGRHLTELSAEDPRTRLPFFLNFT